MIGGIITGALVAGLPQLSEPWPLEPAEMEALAASHNQKLRERLGLAVGPQVMRF